MKDYIETCIKDAVAAKLKLLEIKDDMESVAVMLAECFRNGGKVVLFGNGGSAADAQHIAAEFVGLLDKTKDRESMHAVALTTNTSIVTAIANDFGYDEIFSRQVKGVVNEKDVVIGISTSGNSGNVMRGLEAAKAKGAKAVGLTGGTGGKMKDMGLDFNLVAPADNVNRIQELHITMGHIICGAVERQLYNVG